ncbi:MAG: hypothetical protein ABJF50_07405 [Paracoccaceae bacterium]
MSQVTSQGLINILVGTELGGVLSRQYEVNFAVPNSVLGIGEDNIDVQHWKNLYAHLDE